MPRVAVGQFCATRNLAANLSACQSIISRAAKAGASAVFLPEASDFITNSDEVVKLTQSLDHSAFVQGIREAAGKYKVWVSVGVHEQSPNPSQCYNSHLLISPMSEVVANYHKLHLFDLGTLKESNTTHKGSHLLQPVQTSIGNIGLLTCYDLRFPEVSLMLRNRSPGASILTYPSAFTVKTGEKHWETLLRARAIETQCYVIAAAQIGQHTETRQSWGHAMICDCEGKVIAEVPDGTEPDFALADIDDQLLEQTRQAMPLWSQRRFDVYAALQ